MGRNFDHRFEVIVPIYDKQIQEEITDMFDIQWADNVKSRYVNVEPINQYRKTDSDKPVRSQIEIYNYLKEKHG